MVRLLATGATVATLGYFFTTQKWTGIFSNEGRVRSPSKEISRSLRRIPDVVRWKTVIPNVQHNVVDHRETAAVKLIAPAGCLVCCIT